MIVDTEQAFEGVQLERDDYYNYRFRFPNGASLGATIQEAMLWAIMQKLHEPEIV